MEGRVLPGGFAGQADAPLLWRAVSLGRDQQYFLSHAQRVGVGILGERGPHGFQIRPQSFAADHAHATSEGHGRFGSLFAQSRPRPQRTFGTTVVPVAAEFEEGSAKTARISRAAALGASFSV